MPSSNLLSLWDEISIDVFDVIGIAATFDINSCINTLVTNGLMHLYNLDLSKNVNQKRYF